MSKGVVYDMLLLTSFVWLHLRTFYNLLNVFT